VNDLNSRILETEESLECLTDDDSETDAYIARQSFLAALRTQRDLASWALGATLADYQASHIVRQPLDVQSTGGPSGPSGLAFGLARPSGLAGLPEDCLLHIVTILCTPAGDARPTLLLMLTATSKRFRALALSFKSIERSSQIGSVRVPVAPSPELVITADDRLGFDALTNADVASRLGCQLLPTLGDGNCLFNAANIGVDRVLSGEHSQMLSARTIRDLAADVSREPDVLHLMSENPSNAWQRWLPSESGPAPRFIVPGNYHTYIRTNGMWASTFDIALVATVVQRLAVATGVPMRVIVIDYRERGAHQHMPVGFDGKLCTKRRVESILPTDVVIAYATGHYSAVRLLPPAPSPPSASPAPAPSPPSAPAPTAPAPTAPSAAEGVAHADDTAQLEPEEGVAPDDRDTATAATPATAATAAGEIRLMSAALTNERKRKREVEQRLHSVEEQLHASEEKHRKLIVDHTRTVAQLKTAQAALSARAASFTDPFDRVSQTLRDKVLINGARLDANERALCEALQSLGLADNQVKKFVKQLKAGTQHVRKDLYGTFNGVHQVQNSNFAVRASLAPINAEAAFNDAMQRQLVCDTLKLPMTFFAISSNNNPQTAHIIALVRFYDDTLDAHAQRATSPEEQAALFSNLYKVLYDAAFLHVLLADCKLINFCYPMRDGVHHVVPIDPDAYLRCTQCDRRHIARMGIVALFTAYVSAQSEMPWFFDKLLALVRDLYGEAYSVYAATKARALPSASCADRAKSGTLLAPIVELHSGALAELMHHAARHGNTPLRRTIGSVLGDTLCYLSGHCGNRDLTDPLSKLHLAILGSKTRGGGAPQGHKLDEVRSYLRGSTGVLYHRDVPGATVLADHRADVSSKFFVFVFHTIFAMYKLPHDRSAANGRNIQGVADQWTDHALELQVKLSTSKTVDAYSAFAAAATRPAFPVSPTTHFGDFA